MSKGKEHFLSHAGIYLIARGLPGVIAFAAIPLFSRLLEPSAYGRYALVLAAVNLINALLFQWLRLSLVRYLPAYGADTGKLKSTLATIELLMLAVLGIAAAAMSAAPGLGEVRGLIFPAWVMLAIQALFDLCCEYARALIKPWQYMAMQMMRCVLAVGLGAALIKLGCGWWSPLGGLAAGMGLGVAYAYRLHWRDVRLAIERDTLRKVFQYGAPLSLTVALAVVIGSSDRFLIAGFLGEDAAGLYAVAVDFTSQTLTLLMMVIALAMFPIAVRAFETEGEAAAAAAMRSNAAMLLGIGLPCVVGLAILAPGIAHLFLGSSFRATAARIIPLVAIGAFLAGLKAYHFDSAFQFAHRTIEQVWIVLAAAVLNLGLNVLAIPIWGINGAAGASIVAYIASIGLTIWIGRRHFKLPFPKREAMQITLSAGLMGAMLWPMRGMTQGAAVLALIAAGAAVYGSAMVAMNFMGTRQAIGARLARRESRAAMDISINLGEAA